jgi:hypothetical protein
MEINPLCRYFEQVPMFWNKISRRVGAAAIGESVVVRGVGPFL